MKQLKIRNCPQLSIKGLTKFCLTIYTPDGPDDTEYCAIDFSNGEILYASGNFSNFEPDYENFYAYIIEPFGKDVSKELKFTYNLDMFDKESYHQNLSEEEIKLIESTLIDNDVYKVIVEQAQQIVPDGGYNLSESN
jgi:hypothetical protein